jgi:EAL domain-containing protein (putative c-di-GMP-specific phosphodiesterase class I)
LKIDRGFVKDLLIGRQSAAIVQAIVALAKAMSLRVVAEGVETIGHMNSLMRLDCSVMQGYLFCRPMAPDDMAHWLETADLPRLDGVSDPSLGAPTGRSR